MSELDIDRLEEIAKAATPGARQAIISIHDNKFWVTTAHKRPYTMLLETYGDNAQCDAEYEAALDPHTTLALIAELRQARAEMGRVRAQCISFLRAARGPHGVQYAHNLDEVDQILRDGLDQLGYSPSKEPQP